MGSKKDKRNPFEAFILIVIGISLPPLGMVDAGKQFEKLQGFRQTPAVILSGTITEKDTDDGTEYCPSLRYKFVKNDAWVESDKLTPLGGASCKSARSDAEAFLALYPPGKELKAYADPESASDSFLLAERSHAPYLMMLGGMAALLIGLWLAGVRPREPISFRWLWFPYSLAGVLILLHDRFTGGDWSWFTTALVWLIHAGVPFIVRRKTPDLSED